MNLLLNNEEEDFYGEVHFRWLHQNILFQLQRLS